ncbi:hypothetical protein J3U09_10950 [Gilliamella sp. B2889]|uniref:hypothetical protein n=1 Tax=Gilliamella sp. B2889 TaxID=2817985 RepID=UPI00226A6DA5|nr:hypothetical protein [Gilliamella sp. B2889]MCX8684237.1 hypothetical protein [Gilliamella sp. B2889]
MFVFTVKFEKSEFKRIIITSLSNSLFLLIVTWYVHDFSYLYLTDVVFIFGINYVFANLLFIAICRKNVIRRSRSGSGRSSRSSYSYSSRIFRGGGGGRSGGASGRWS